MRREYAFNADKSVEYALTWGHIAGGGPRPTPGAGAATEIPPLKAGLAISMRMRARRRAHPKERNEHPSEGDHPLMSPTTTRAKSESRRPNTDQQFVRLNVNLNAETAAALKELAAERDISFTEAVRRAISVYKYMDDETHQGRRIQTTDADRGDVREVVLM